MPSRRRPLTMDNMNNRTRPVAQLYRALESEIFHQMAQTFKRRANIPMGESGTLQYQIERLADLQNIEESTIKRLAQMTGRVEEEIREALITNGGDVIHDTDHFLKQAGIRVTPVKDVRRLVDTYINQTFLEIDNYINQTLITTNFGQGSLAMMYRDALSDVQISFSAGHYTLDEAIGRAVMKWIDKGVPSTFIDKGGHRWSMTRYVETVLRSTNSRLYNELRIRRMAEFDMTLVVMSSKLSAREACAPIQGKVVDISVDRKKPNYPNVHDYGYGEPWGTRGINCGHMWFPYKEGISHNTQVQYDPEEAMEMEKLNQQRNKLDRDIDKLRQKIDAAETLELKQLPDLKDRLKRKMTERRQFEESWRELRQDFYDRSK